jgi:hypothetical protein
MRCKFLIAQYKIIKFQNIAHFNSAMVFVSHPGKGECADPVIKDAILEGAGGRRPGRNRERQFGSDTGDGKT